MTTKSLPKYGETLNDDPLYSHLTCFCIN